MHWWMVTFSFAVRLLLFGQKLQDNTEESARTNEEHHTRVEVERFLLQRQSPVNALHSLLETLV